MFEKHSYNLNKMKDSQKEAAIMISPRLESLRVSSSSSSGSSSGSSSSSSSSITTIGSGVSSSISPGFESPNRDWWKCMHPSDGDYETIRLGVQQFLSENPRKNTKRELVQTLWALIHSSDDTSIGIAVGIDISSSLNNNNNNNNNSNNNNNNNNNNNSNNSNNNNISQKLDAIHKEWPDSFDDQKNCCSFCLHHFNLETTTVYNVGMHILKCKYRRNVATIFQLIGNDNDFLSMDFTSDKSKIICLKCQKTFEVKNNWKNNVLHHFQKCINENISLPDHIKIRKQGEYKFFCKLCNASIRKLWSQHQCGADVKVQNAGRNNLLNYFSPIVSLVAGTPSMSKEKVLLFIYFEIL